MTLFNRGAVASTGIIPSGQRLIQDCWSLKVVDTKMIKESVNNGGRPAMRITGLFQEGDLENANGRVYPYAVLKPAVLNIQEEVGSRAVMGELDHPADAKIHLDRISHLITKLWMDGKKVYGEAEILDSQPHGAMLRGLFESKVRMGISSRGVGDMEMRESDGQQYDVVCDGFNFVTWDAVAEPSVNGAILKQLNESKQRVRTQLREGKNKSLFGPEVYQARLAEEIRRAFGLK